MVRVRVIASIGALLTFAVKLEGVTDGLKCSAVPALPFCQISKFEKMFTNTRTCPLGAGFELSRYVILPLDPGKRFPTAVFSCFNASLARLWRTTIFAVLNAFLPPGLSAVDITLARQMESRMSL